MLRAAFIDAFEASTRADRRDKNCVGAMGLAADIERDTGSRAGDGRTNRFSRIYETA
jgi:hypothetical protein